MATRRHPPVCTSSLPRRALSIAVLSALLGTPLLTRAQIAPDPNAGAHRPGTDTAANGTPVVNIVAPSAAGVSHNQYQQFNVDKQGLILNNAAGVSPTQLGGYITGNPNYQAGQSAKVIVNEVTSTNPTYLRGYTEVAGNAADVIIANPNGISVNGGGFINTNRATLTTGVPTFGGDGSLSAFHTTGGAISIDGDGLNASNIDRLDLITRSVAVNGKVWANNLNVVTGANQVGYADLSTRAIAGDGAAPGVSVDVAALGGMYAHRIHLIGTEAGIGVRNAGELATQSGDFTINSAGQLQLTGTTSSAGNLTINGGALNNSGALQSAGTLSAQVTGDVSNTGTVYSAGDLNLKTGGMLSNGKLIAAANNTYLRAQQLVSQGTLGAGIAGDGSLQGNGALQIVMDGNLAATGRNLAAGSITLQGSALNLAGAQTQAGANVALTSTAGDITHSHATLAANGALTVRSAGTVDNSASTMQAGQLDAQAAAWRNAYGTVQTSGPMTVQIGGLLDNTNGTWASAQNAALRAGSIDNSNGTLYAAHDLALSSTGWLRNTGTVYAGNALDLSANQLDSSGTLRSDGAQTIRVDSNATLAGITYAGGASSWQVGNTLTSTGTLAAQGDLTIAAGNLLASGILAAGLTTDGNLAGIGNLAITTYDTLTATGQNMAAGALHFAGNSLNLAGATTRAGSDIGLTASEGDINHTSGDLATNGRLDVQAAQAVINTQGRLQAGQLNLHGGSFANTQGHLLQTGSGDTTLNVAGALDNTGGVIATNAANLTINAGMLDNTRGTLQHAGTGTLSLSTHALTNAQGQIVGNGDLALTSQTTHNNGGTLSVAGNATVSGSDLDNTGGTLVSQTLQANLAGMFTNTGGLLQASRASLVANALDNGDGQIKALSGDLDLFIAQALTSAANGFIGGNNAVNLSAGSFDNAGQLYAGSNLTLTTQGDVINHGAVQALGDLQAHVGGMLTNDGGRIEAGTGQGNAALLISASALNNQNGRIANTDSGSTNVSAGSIDNTGGTLGGQGDVTLNATQLTNNAGTVVSGGHLALQSNDLNNANGMLYSAGNLAWNNSAATLDNTGGSIGAGGDIALTLDTAHNDGGDIAANGNVASQFNAFDGIGRLRAGYDLALTLNGNYTNQVGNTLFANHDFTFNVGGAFINASGATLQSVGALTVNAASVDNQAGALINSGTTTLTAATQTNEGRIEGDTVTLNAGDLINIGTVIGNAITVNASTLTNGTDLGTLTDNNPYQTALIAAVNQLNLYVSGDLLNRDAMLFTTGDLVIAADASGARNRSVTNLSGDIEANGNIFIASDNFTNQRRVLNTETHQLTAAEQAQNTQTHRVAITGATDEDLYNYCVSIYVPHQYACRNNDDINNNDPLQANGYINTTDIITAITRLTATSAESRLLAGGNITLNGSVLNSNSTIAAGNNLVINGQDGNAGGGNVGGFTVRNEAFAPTATVETTVEKWVAMKYKDGDFGGSWHGDPDLRFYNAITDITLAAGAIPFRIIDAGPSLKASMTAGNEVDISGQDISNTIVDADGNPVVGVNLGANGSTNPITGNGPGNVGNVGGNADTGNLGAIGPAPGSQLIGTPEQPYPVQLPSGGLYTIKPGNGSPYLVETDPRFASYGGFLGSDYLLNRLGLDGDLTLKRLGDAFYETQLVMGQITSLTGRRYLDGDPDALEQYKALMDAGVEEAQQFNLAVGVALTPDQIAHLTQDMVWMVSEQVNGESVLVPVVYLSQKTANAVASGAVIQGTTVSLNASNQLTNTGTVQAAQDASLKAGNLLNAGNLAAGSNLSVQAAQDLLNVGAIQGGNVALVAGNNLVSSTNVSDVHLGNVNLGGVDLPDATRLGINTGGSITSIGNLTAQAGNDLTLNHATVSAGQNLGLAAGNNLTATASALKAGGDAQLIAGSNLSLNADQHTVYQGTSGNLAVQTVHDVTTVSAGGNAVLAAGNDLASQGAQLKAGDQLALSAGHDITLNAVADSQIAQGYSSQGRTHTTTLSTDEALRGTDLNAANGLAISAGHDLTTVAANITSDNGAIALAAGHDINLNAGYENHTWQQDSTTKKSGFLSSTTTTTHDASQDSLAVGTLLSGNTVTVAAGHDLTTQAAQIVATDDVVMAAGNNLTIGTATSTHSEQHNQTTKTSGLFTSGMNLMIGASKESQSYSETDTTPQGSLIGSLNGGVTLTAGNLVHITGSDVISQSGTAIVGKDVTIDAAVGTQDTTQTYKQQQSGLTLGLGGAVANAVGGAVASAQRGSEVKDDRLKALYAAQAYYQAGDALGMAQQGGLQGATDKNPGGVTLQLGIGASSASSTTTTHDETAYGSHIRSNGDVTIAATGGDLNIIGSQIDGNNVALAAANNLNILSQAENHSLESSNKNASGGVGIQIGSDGVGFYAQASVGKGSAHGNGITHAESLVNADGTLTLISGNDTTIKGAQLTGNTVLAAIGGNLLIQSEQDTDDYASKQQQLGAKMVIGYGSGGSVSYNQSKIDSHYQSVNEVSGIHAGSGGFDIAVGGNTHLVGGVIASSADPSKNLLDTGSLTYESLHNEANYSTSNVGASVGYGDGSFSGSPMIGVPQGEKSSSDTNSGIAQGTVIVRDGHADLSGLDRNPTLDNQALNPIFDAQKVQEQMEMGQVAGQVGMTAAGDLAGKMGWAEGSPERTILHGVVGAGIAALGGGDIAQGALGAAANQLVVQKMADYLESQGYTPGTPEFASMLQLASTAVGAAVGGGAGAATALDGTTYNYLTHQQLTDLQKEINQCNGDRVCIETAKSSAEILSANQEQQLISDCGGSANSLSDACKANILAAYAYANDPLAAQLGLQMDQTTSLQDYLNHRSEWGLVYADHAVSQNGQWMFAPAVAGAGTAVAVAAAPATLAWGQEAWAAYQAATQGYSMGAAMGTGALSSGGFYTGSSAIGAGLDWLRNDSAFGDSFNQRFSLYGLIGTMGIGALGGGYQTSMFQSAGVINSWRNISTVEGAVIRGNQILISTPLKKAVQSAAKESNNANPNPANK